MTSRYATEDSPEARMGQMLGGYRTTQMLHVAAKLGLADALGKGPNSVDELAAGRGITIWRLELDGQWRCVVDIWNDPPPALVPSSK